MAAVQLRMHHEACGRVLVGYFVLSDRMKLGCFTYQGLLWLRDAVYTLTSTLKISMYSGYSGEWRRDV